MENKNATKVCVQRADKFENTYFTPKLYFHGILKSNNALCTEFCNNHYLFSSILYGIMSSLHNTSVVLHASQILLSKL